MKIGKTLHALGVFACSALLLFAAAAGCKKESKAYKIGISIPSADHGWTGGVVFWAEQAKKDIEAQNPDVEVIVTQAKDSAEQADKMESLIVQGVQAIVVLPNEPAPLTNVCEKAVKNGIKLVVVDRNLTRNVQDLTVAGDNPGFGRVAAEVMARELNGQGNIILLEGVQCAVNTDRVNAFKAVMKNYPGIKILDSGVTDWSTEKALKLMENFLQKHGRIDAVWAGDDDVLRGVLKAYEESKRSDIKLFIGGGGSKYIIKRILDKDPAVRLTVTYPPKMLYTGAEEALKLLKNKDGAAAKGSTIIVPAEAVDASNAAKHYFPASAY